MPVVAGLRNLLIKRNHSLNRDAMRTKVPESLYLPAPKLNQLLILNKIGTNPHITQAELARLCGLSVAMVNNYMKELCSDGLLEYRRRSSKNVSYHLTALGGERAEATRHDLLRELVRLFADAKNRVKEAIFKQAIGDLKRVVIYGRGDLAEVAFHALDESGVNIVGVCDDDHSIIDRDWCGRQVLSTSQIRHMSPDAVLVVDSHKPGLNSPEFTSLPERGIRVIILDDCTRESQGSGPLNAIMTPQ